MPHYEVMTIFDSALTEEALDKSLAKMSKLIDSHEGKVDQVNKWGKRRLAFTIDHKRDGYYVVTDFQGNGSTVNELKRVLKISDEALRFMIVKRTDREEA